MQRRLLVLVSLTVLAVAACESGGPAGGRPASTTTTLGTRPRHSTSKAPRAVSPWVGFANGKLVYGHDTDGNRIPDFSYAGYGGGGAALPDVPDKARVSPSGSDDTAAIQRAIADVAALSADSRGIRGAVLLAPGRYRIGGTLAITVPGVLLRGSGSGQDGSVLVAEGAPRTLIQLGDPKAARGKVPNSEHKIMDDYVPVGAATFRVDNASAFAPGDRVVVARPVTQQWIHELGMDQIPDRGGTQQWKPGEGLQFERQVTAVDRDKITIDVPLTNALEKKWADSSVWKYTFDARIAQVGVEHLRSDGAAFANDPGYHDNGYFLSQLVGVGAVEDGWVRDVVGQHYGSTFDVGGASTRITVVDTASIDMIIPPDIHAQPVAYTVSGQRVLVRNCEITGSNLHAWATQSRVAGPNVFSSCTATNTGSQLLDAGPHQRWASGTLYENVTMRGNGHLKLVDRGNLGSGQGWAGANSVLWNCAAEGYVVENPPTAHNWAIGCIGKRLDSPKPPGEYESIDKAVEPHSLYAQQLAERPH